MAVSHNDASGNNECQASVSYDGGITYGSAYDLPLVQGTDFCSDPVVRATPAPSGFYFVFSYLSVRSDLSTNDVVTAVTDGLDPAILISGPVTVVAGAPTSRTRNGSPSTRSMPPTARSTVRTLFT